jgi:hypothetical protein
MVLTEYPEGWAVRLNAIILFQLNQLFTFLSLSSSPLQDVASVHVQLPPGLCGRVLEHTAVCHHWQPVLGEQRSSFRPVQVCPGKRNNSQYQLPLFVGMESEKKR